jgi:hypothetical protein
MSSTHVIFRFAPNLKDLRDDGLVDPWSSPALLASPAIALEYLLAKLAIRIPLQAKPRDVLGQMIPSCVVALGNKPGNAHYRTSQGPNRGRAFPSLPSIAALVMLLS